MANAAAIYAAIAAISVTASGATPTVHDHDELPASIQTGRLPVRLLLPFDEAADAQSFARYTVGGTSLTGIQLIHDLMLWETTGQGRNLAQHAGPLVAYCDAYLAAMAANTKLVRSSTQAATIEGVSLERGVYPYGGVEFYGVKATLTIRDLS